MILAHSVITAMQAALKDAEPSDYKLQSITPVLGGDINTAYRLSTKKHRYFVKINNDKSALSMFLAEKNGLDLLRRTLGVAHVPHVLTVGSANDNGFLLMRWLESRDSQNNTTQEALGRTLASLHRKRAKRFGLEYDNFIGKLPQMNKQSDDWATFFRDQRLKRQLAIAGDTVRQNRLLSKFETLFTRLPELFPAERPSLLHGDLWSGNYLVDVSGIPVLIDPAPYFGYREMDIAMSKLFGGFTERFYAAYNEAFPLLPDWKSRTDLWNLYPLLVHFNLFGNGYLSRLEICVNKYI